MWDKLRVPLRDKLMVPLRDKLRVPLCRLAKWVTIEAGSHQWVCR